MRKPVLTIFYQFNPWRSSIGGIQTLIKSFIKYAPSEFEVRLVGVGDDKSQATLKWQVGEFEGREISFLPLLYLPNDNVRKRIPTTIKYTAALMGRCFESDFMHFHRLEPTLATRHWRGDKTLFIHNDIQTQMQAVGDKQAILWRRFPPAYFALENFLISQFSQILACNNAAVELYRQRYWELANRIEFIKNSFDNEIFYPLTEEEREAARRDLAQRLNLVEETRFILFAGRLHPQKDPILLVRAFAAVKEPHAHLLIAGEGELEPAVQTEIHRLGISARVTMMGAVSQMSLASLHRLCNACILTSAYEGLPIVVLEALGSGTPVITTNCGETPKLLAADSGIVCYERTPAAIAEALSKILRHPEYYPISACARAAQPYAARTVIGNIYNQMLERWEMRTLSAVQS